VLVGPLWDDLAGSRRGRETPTSPFNVFRG